MKKIHRIDIRALDNGFQMDVHHKSTGNESPYYEDRTKEETIHPSSEHLISHLKGVLKKHSLKNKITSKTMENC